MSLPVNIKLLLEQRIVESTRIEYKTDWNPEAVLHSICAFANDIDNCGGGYIVLGVEERDGRPVLPVCGLPAGRIDHINKELVTASELATQLGYARLTATVSRAVKELVSEGKIKMSHPDNPHSQNQKLSLH